MSKAIFVVATSQGEPMAYKFEVDEVESHLKRRAFDEMFPYSAPHVVEKYILAPATKPARKRSKKMMRSKFTLTFTCEHPDGMQADMIECYRLLVSHGLVGYLRQRQPDGTEIQLRESGIEWKPKPVRAKRKAAR